jgi:hypothetical protein
LPIHPELHRGPEKAGEPQGGLGRDPAPFAHDLVDPCGSDADRAREGVAREAQWQREVLAQDLGRGESGAVCRSWQRS